MPSYVEDISKKKVQDFKNELFNKIKYLENEYLDNLPKDSNFKKSYLDALDEVKDFIYDYK